MKRKGILPWIYSLVLITYLFTLIKCEGKFSIKLNKIQELDLKSFFAKQLSFKTQILPQRVKAFESKQMPNIQQLNLDSKPEEISAAIDRSFENLKEVIPLKNYLDVQYTGSINIGKDEQLFTILFDSGSNKLWVPQDTCTTCNFGENRYSCIGQACKLTTDEIQYGKGYVKGYKAQDTVKIGNKSTSFPFLTIFESQDLDGFQSDGILGLGVNRKESIVNQLFLEKKIEKNLFTFKLSTENVETTDSSNKKKEQNVSELVFGGIDESIVGKNEISYYPLVSTNYWAIRMNSAKFGKNDLFNIKKDYRSALIDSGTSLIHMPTPDYANFNRTIFTNNQNCMDIGIIVCICSEKSISKQPSISITLTDKDNNDQVIDILPKYYILYSEGFCVYMVQEFPNIGINNMWILGDVFMRQTYNVFSYEKQAIGIVNLEQQDGTPATGGSLFGGVGKLFIIVLVIGIGAFLAKYIYENYIQKQPSPQQQFQQYNNQNIPLNPLNENLV